MASDHLTRLEKDDLASLEDKIEHGLHTFCEVGGALLTIRDRRLYRDSHETFEAYCRDRWGMTRQYANRLIGAAQIAFAVETIGTTPPANEAQARPLVGMEPEQAAAVLDGARAAAEAEGHPLTAAEIEAYARQAGIDLSEEPQPDPRRKLIDWYAGVRVQILRRFGKALADERRLKRVEKLLQRVYEVVAASQ